MITAQQLRNAFQKGHLVDVRGKHAHIVSIEWNGWEENVTRIEVLFRERIPYFDGLVVQPGEFGKAIVTLSELSLV